MMEPGSFLLAQQCRSINSLTKEKIITMKKILDFGYNLVAIMLIAAVLLAFFGPMFALCIALALLVVQFIPLENAPAGSARERSVKALVQLRPSKRFVP
jgi:hypothetical protein